MKRIYVPYKKDLADKTGREICKVLEIDTDEANVIFGFRCKDIKSTCCETQQSIEDDVCPECGKSINIIDCFAPTYDELYKSSPPYIHNLLDSDESNIFLSNVFEVTYKEN